MPVPLATDDKRHQNSASKCLNQREKYFPRLDGLRAVAILMVLVHHLGGYLAHVFDSGYYGVDLFFVISGYLITSILVSSKGKLF
ncbi:MAG: acyltransferase [Planctomycetaceae bacterium]